MRKSLSLLLAGALTAGYAFSVTVAPLAKKDCGAPSIQKVLTRKAGKPSKFSLPKVRQITSGIKGFHDLTPRIVKTNNMKVRHASAARVVSSTVDLAGSRMSASDWEDTSLAGLYHIPTSGNSPIVEPIGNLGTGYASGYFDGEYFYGFNFTTFWGMYFCEAQQVNLETGETVDLDSKDLGLLVCASYDATTSTPYGVVVDLNTGAYQWCAVDLSTDSKEVISTIGDGVVPASIGIDAAGNAYCLDSFGAFYSVNKDTGDFTKISDTGVTSDYVVGGVFNDKDNTFISSYSSDNAGGLVEINPATGEATILTEFPTADEVSSLFIMKPAAEAKAPAVPALEAACADGSLDVKLTLTLSTKLFDESDCTDASLSFCVTADGEEVWTGSGAPGDVLENTVTLTKNGAVKFVAIASNAVGASPKGKAECFVGKGSPKSPANVVLAWADGVATLTWDAVTEAADAGFFEAANVTYNVLDSDGNVLAENLTATSWSKDVAEPAEGCETLNYSVEAVYSGLKSTPVASNFISLGAFDVPVKMVFTSEDVFNLHTVLNSNCDDRTWTYYEQCASYEYSSTNDADDWLFSPSIKLEAGKVYPFDAQLTASETWPEKLEILYGQGGTVEAMTEVILEPTDISGFTNLNALLKPTVTGRYNIGFHAITPADRLRIFLFKYSIGEGLEPTAPEAPTELVVEAAPNGDAKATVSFKAPELNLAGEKLSDEVTVKVYRNDELIKTLSGAPCMTFSFIDELEDTGDYTYTFTSFAGDAKGLSASISAYVGPLTPCNVNSGIVYQSGDNQLTANWDPVTTDIAGTVLPEGNITYNVFEGFYDDGYLSVGDQLNEAPLTEPTFTWTSTIPEKQGYSYLVVQSCNRGVPSANKVGISGVVGKPYEMPVKYTSGDSLDSYFLGYSRSSGSSSLGLGTTAELNVPSKDSDGEFFFIQNENEDESVTLISGLVNISGDKPILKFYIYPLIGEDGTTDENLTRVDVTINGENTELATFKHSSLTPEEWNKITVDLSAYKGKTIQVNITGISKTFSAILYDNINICQDLDYDLSASISAPAKVGLDNDFDVTVKVANEGSLAAGGFSVKLLRDGEIVETRESTGLDAETDEEFVFTQRIGRADKEATFSALVEFAEDQDPDSNEADPVVVARILSKYPAPVDLAGEASENGNVLTWTAINTDNPVATESTEDFEEAESFADEFGGWTFVNLDGVVKGGFNGLDIPNHPIKASYSFFVFDASDDNFDESFAAHSGDKYLATMFNNDDSQIDDWAISPELPGTVQSIDFFAKSYNGDYPESVEIWICTEDSTDPAIFTKLEEFGTEEVPGEWTEYSAELPEGTKRFAIRSCAEGSFLLMLDDVTFTSFGELGTINILGYNVYSDGDKVNDALVTESTFTHPADGKTHTYNVTSVYDKGESEFSSPLIIETISGIILNKANQLRVAVEDRNIVIAGANADKVVINTVDGQTIYSAAGDARVPVQQAIYLVTVGRRTFKVIVR